MFGMPQPHLKLVTDDFQPAPSIVEQKDAPPWAWLGLLAVTIAAPVVRKIADTLAVFEE